MEATSNRGHWPDLRRLGVCIAYGIGFALVYSVWVVLITRFPRGAAALDTIGISLARIIGLYFAGGVVGGTMVGLAWPLTRWRVGAGIVGYVAVLPFFASLALMDDAMREPAAFWFVVLVASLVGFFFAIWLWSDKHRQGAAR
jgi:hypothetical protein